MSSSPRNWFGGLVDLELPQGKIEFEEGHAAADIVADKLRVDTVAACGHAHRAIFARVEVGERSDRHHARQGRDIEKLFFGRALDPGRGGVETRNRAVARRRVKGDFAP